MHLQGPRSLKPEILRFAQDDNVKICLRFQERIISQRGSSIPEAAALNHKPIGVSHEARLS
jgi:hypothetical protein